VKNIFTRKASVLGERQWKTLPWLQRSKTPKDVLLDLFVELPRLFETFDRFRKGCRADDTLDLMQHLVKNCLHLSNELVSWHLSTGSHIESRVITTMAGEDKRASVEHLASAQLLGLYWCCLLLFLELRQTAAQFQEARILANIPTIEGAQTICSKILQVITMLLGPNSGWLGINLAACPLLLIHNYIQRPEQVTVMEREACILQEILGTAKGRILATFIRGATWSRVATDAVKSL
jgi:hypothetical protein